MPIPGLASTFLVFLVLLDIRPFQTEVTHVRKVRNGIHAPHRHSNTGDFSYDKKHLVRRLYHFCFVRRFYHISSIHSNVLILHVQLYIKFIPMLFAKRCRYIRLVFQHWTKLNLFCSSRKLKKRCSTTLTLQFVRKFPRFIDANGISRSNKVFSGTWAKGHNTYFCLKRDFVVFIKVLFHQLSSVFKQKSRDSHACCLCCPHTYLATLLRPKN